MRLAAALVLALIGTPAFAQGVQQNGAITPGHGAYWVNNGTIGDAGPATAGNLTELGVTKLGGCAYGVTTGPLSGSFNQMCLGIDNTQAFLSVQNYNGAPAVPFNFIINGITYPVSALQPLTFFGVAQIGFTRLTTNGQTPNGSNCLYVPLSTAIQVSVAISAIDRTNGDTATWNSAQGALIRASGSASYSGANTGQTAPSSHTGAGISARTFIGADVTNECLAITWLSPNNDTWSVVATVQTTIAQ